jgi:undecaprenyl diphosphate synthase
MTYTSSTLRVPEVGAVPRHIAIIMDGNGRWATQRRLPRVAGHSKGLDAVRLIVEACATRGVEFLTLFAFSSENWRRPVDEVSFLMRLFVVALERELARLHANGIRLRVVGDVSKFDDRIRELIRRAEVKTARNTRLTLTIAANYGGRWDILQATRKYAEEAIAADRGLSPAARAAAPGMEPGFLAAVDETSLAKHLAMAYAPEPELFIRTGGEQRVSNFMLWHLAYTELYFTDLYWPDFGEAALDTAIEWFRERERRFGRTSAQIEPQALGANSLPC